MSRAQDLRDLDAVTVSTEALTGKAFCLETTSFPSGEIEARFADGTTMRGWSKEVLAYARRHLIECEHAADRRTLDADGFLLGSQPSGPMNLPRSFGGLSSAVGTRDGRVGIVTGLETDPDDEELRLHIVWLPDADPDVPVALDVRDDVMTRLDRDDARPERVRAYGLLALDV